MRLHRHWRSTAAYRARIALNLKGLSDSLRNHSLQKGAQQQATYAWVNP
jgi:glutathione S-transferase